MRFSVLLVAGLSALSTAAPVQNARGTLITEGAYEDNGTNFSLEMLLRML